MQRNIEVDGQHLSAAVLAELVSEPIHVVVSAAAMQRVRKSNEWAVRLQRQRPIYGRSTGVGANREVGIEPSVAAAQSLLRSHATAAGAPRSAERVRAMLLIRLNQLCAAGSGVSADVVEGLARLLSDDALPTILEHAGVGTADLSALAAAALAIQTHSPSWRAEPLVLGPDDALPFLSSNAAALADAGLALSRLAMTARSALTVAALSFTALDGNLEAFSVAVEHATPMLGARATCRAMRSLVGSHPSKALRLQDPYGLRALPQSHGVLLDSLAALRDTVDAYINSASENPIITPYGEIAHHGAFHASYLSLAGDTVRNAAVQSGQLALHRLTYLNEPAHTGLTPFLGDGTPGASGTMLVEYVAAAALGDLRALATAATLQTTSVSRGAEDTASFASLSARQLLGTADNYELLIAAEMLAAVRAHRMRADQLDGPLASVLKLCIPLREDTRDRDLTEDIQIARGLIPALATPTAIDLPRTSFQNDL